MRTGIDFGGDRARDGSKAARAVRFRIMVLMILLLLVIFAMKEAGKPQRWMWMGFDKIEQSSSKGDFLVDARDASADEAMDWTIAKSTSGKLLARVADETGDRDLRGESAIGLSTAKLDQQSDNELDREFWQDAYKRLPEEKQMQLFGLLRKVVRSDFAATAETEVTALKKIIQRLKKEQSDFQTLALSEISLLSDGQEKQKKTKRLFEFDSRWQTEVVPTLDAAVAGDDFSFGGQVEIRKVVQILRPQFFDAVEDMAGMGTGGDLPGWLTVWDEAIAGPPWGSSRASILAGEVSFLQLSGQPDNYRGQQVSIAGQARTCRKKLLKETQLPVDHYYEVWVEPVDVDGDGLFCVYAAEIPDSFPVDLLERESGRFHEVDVPVSLTGRFFKIRSYRDLGDGVSHSPVVITRRIDSVGKTLPTEGSSARAIPGWSKLVVWFLAIATLAMGLAIALFRTTRSPSRKLGQSTVNRTQRSLKMLERDQSIKSPAQRVAELAEEEGCQSENDMEQETDQ